MIFVSHKKVSHVKADPGASKPNPAGIGAERSEVKPRTVH